MGGGGRGQGGPWAGGGPIADLLNGLQFIRGPFLTQSAFIDFTLLYFLSGTHRHSSRGSNQRPSDYPAEPLYLLGHMPPNID